MPPPSTSPKPSVSSRPKPAASKKRFPSILTQVIINTYKFDLRSVKSWLTTFLKAEYPQYDKFIAAMVMDHLGNNKYPDGKVIRVELSDLGLLPLDQVDRIMRKLWSHMDKEQNRQHEKHHEKYQKISTPRGSSTRLSSNSNHANGNDIHKNSSTHTHDYDDRSSRRHSSSSDVHQDYSSSIYQYSRSSSVFHHDSRVYYLNDSRF